MAGSLAPMDDQTANATRCRAELPERILHVWYARVEQDDDPPLDTLDAISRLRFEHVKDEAARRRQAWSHVILRQLLRRYLGNDPTLTRRPVGKPTLEAPSDWLQFSMSRSDALAAYALGRNIEVGVDIERIDRSLPVEALARRLPHERSLAVQRAHPCNRAQAFFRQWTAHEAEVKTTGEGLARFRQSPKALTVHWPAAPAGYAVAVAARGRVRSVKPAAWEAAVLVPSEATR